MTALPWWGWFVAAGVLAVGEMHMPGTYLIWLAVGAAVTGACDAALGLSLEGQIASFVLASAASCGGGYFVYRHLHRPRRSHLRLNERSQAMVGARGVVCDAFINGHGKVRLGDGVWLASGPDLAEGSAVVVSAVHGTRLFVEPAKPRTAAS
ncbi:MAG: NfeD family protein [Thiohalocapsa sp.]